MLKARILAVMIAEDSDGVASRVNTAKANLRTSLLRAAQDRYFGADFRGHGRRTPLAT
jgi:hypothetical protein